ncbi:MAG TPA: hypothetical protein VJT80_12920 [Steroidobacteraceae bacterium]|nr:hypothetical protein [Steroidobacteraceae bacterium]
MNRRIVIALATAALTLSATAGLAQDKPSNPPMHMHKSEMNHRKDADVSQEFKSEATQLRGEAREVL